MADSSGSARSGPEGLLPRVNLANPLSYAPRPRRKGGKSRSRGGGRGCEPPLLPLFFVGELLLLLLVRGEGKYEGAGALYCAPGRYTYSAVVYASRFPYAIHTPSECDGDRTHRSLGLETRPPSRTHTLRFFSGWGIGDPVVGGRTPFCQFMTGGFRGRTTLDRLIGRLTS